MFKVQTASFLIGVGDNFHISKSTVNRIILKVPHYIALIHPQFINMPHPQKCIAINKIWHIFYNRARILSVLAAIDCTHIQIKLPGVDSGEFYHNRKGWFNTDTLCV